MNLLNDVLLILPELWVLGMACVILLVDLWLSRERKGVLHFLAILTLAFALILTWHDRDAAQGTEAFAGTFVRDHFADVLKTMLYLVVGLSLTYAKNYLRDRELYIGEFYVLALLALLGMMVMVSAGSLVTLYLGLELLALCSYGLVGMNRDSAISTESAMKYFVLGALASGILLYGMSMIYGVTGSLDLSTIAERAVALRGDDVVLAFGLAFLVVGLAFKFGAVPFHMWLPDVYQGAPTAITLFIASAPKIAAFAFAIRLLVDGLDPLRGHWAQMLTLLAIASLAVGNIVAIAQVNFKRMLAYSTISHVGFLLLGILAGTPEGYAAAMFYAIVYALSAAGAFGLIVLLARKGFEADQLDDLKGLSQRSPWYALIALMLMASLAGIPLFAGFISKFLVLKAVVQAGHVWLAAYAVVMSVIGMFYYLRVIKLMYFDEPDQSEPLRAPVDVRFALSANGLAQVALGIFPGALIALCVAAVATL
jgi:NADH-quinone oxidoreductase subunit N